jgi:hypothetical protein
MPLHPVARRRTTPEPTGGDGRVRARCTRPAAALAGGDGLHAPTGLSAPAQRLPAPPEIHRPAVNRGERDKRRDIEE